MVVFLTLKRRLRIVACLLLGIALLGMLRLGAWIGFSLMSGPSAGLPELGARVDGCDWLCYLRSFSRLLIHRRDFAIRGWDGHWGSGGPTCTPLQVVAS